MKLRTRSYTGTRNRDVTQRELDHGRLAREAAAEGIVLLKNEDHLLPIPAGSRIGLYGAGAVKTVKGGTGSGDVNERHSVSIYEGLANAGYEITSSKWLDSYSELYDQSRLEWKEEIMKKMHGKDGNFFEAYSSTPYRMPSGEALDREVAKKDGADTGIFVLSRNAGENKDRLECQGDYYITEEELKLLKDISDTYKNVVLVINAGGIVDLQFTDEIPNLKAVLYFVQAGQEGGNALADILRGDVTPSGKLTDTWAEKYGDYPNASYFSYKSQDVFKEEYKEGIYVGYRYFDTFDVPVRFGFGYGLSYTDFQVTADSAELIHQGTILGAKGPELKIISAVENTGKQYSGKEVVQVYVSCPQKSLKKEYRRLVGYAKTKLLQPGEKQILTIAVPLWLLSSYDEESSSWILEEGLYGIWIGNSLEKAKLWGSLQLDAEVVLSENTAVCGRKENLEELELVPEKLSEKEKMWHEEASKLPVILLNENIFKKEMVSYTLKDEKESAAWKITETLSEEQLVAFTTGDPNRGQAFLAGMTRQTVPGAAAETTSVAAEEPWGVASMVLADGPAGLRLKKEYQVIDGVVDSGTLMEALEGGFLAEKKEMTGTVYYQYCTAIPVGTLLAQTWNQDLLRRVGEMIGQEMRLFEVTLWLAPGMNIHRNPLCGRNFEYYSEDPFLSGMAAAAITKGVQSVQGCGTPIKHFACNNQEDNRMGSDSVVSERALREIYLRGFEIAVKDAQPMAIMTSYNMINGIHAANSHDLCTKVARCEWGFEGVIMTDWTTTTDSTAGEISAAGCIRAGNDLVMPGAPEDIANIREELAKGTLLEEDLKSCVSRIIKICLASNQYEDAVSYPQDSF